MRSGQNMLNSTFNSHPLSDANVAGINLRSSCLSSVPMHLENTKSPLRMDSGARSSPHLSTAPPVTVSVWFKQAVTGQARVSAALSTALKLALLL